MKNSAAVASAFYGRQVRESMH